MSSVTMGFDTDRLVGVSLPVAQRVGKLNGYKVIARDPENYLAINWLSEDWNVNVAYVTVRNGIVTGVQRQHSNTANWNTGNDGNVVNYT